jgi:hypothetical protein
LTGLKNRPRELLQVPFDLEVTHEKDGICGESVSDSPALTLTGNKRETADTASEIRSEFCEPTGWAHSWLVTLCLLPSLAGRLAFPFQSDCSQARAEHQERGRFRRLRYGKDLGSPGLSFSEIEDTA